MHSVHYAWNWDRSHPESKAFANASTAPHIRDNIGAEVESVRHFAEFRAKFEKMGKVGHTLSDANADFIPNIGQNFFPNIGQNPQVRKHCTRHSNLLLFNSKF